MFPHRHATFSAVRSGSPKLGQIHLSIEASVTTTGLRSDVSEHVLNVLGMQIHMQSSHVPNTTYRMANQ